MRIIAERITSAGTGDEASADFGSLGRIFWIALAVAAVFLVLFVILLIAVRDRRDAEVRQQDRLGILRAINEHSGGDLTKGTDLSFGGLFSKPLRKARRQRSMGWLATVRNAQFDVAELIERGLLARPTYATKGADGGRVEKDSDSVQITPAGIESASSGNLSAHRPDRGPKYSVGGNMQVNYGDGNPSQGDYLDASIGKGQIDNSVRLTIDSLLETILDDVEDSDRADAAHFAGEVRDSTRSTPPSRRRWDAAVDGLSQVGLGAAGNAAWEALKALTRSVF